jgi:hypothetical protein
MAAINKSIYEELILESTDQKRTIDIRQGTISIDYYEDIFSPTITAKIRVVDTGDTIQPPDKEGNPDGEKQSIYNGLPLRGGERVSLKIKGNTDKNPGLDFATNQKDYLYVSTITDIVTETQRETFLLHLTSREAITNETSRVGKKYPTSSTIDTSVKDILKNYLKTDKIGTIDKTQNKYGFIGNLRKPFTVLVWLASKGVPAEISKDATAGFVFYQTREGFQFRSIDSLISQKPDQIPTYTYTQVNESGVTRDNDFAILNYKTDSHSDLIEQLRVGAFSSYRMFYNPLTFEFTDPQKGTFTIDDYTNGIKNLGQKFELPKITNSSNVDLGHIPTRFLTQVLDIGTIEKDVSTDVNSDPFKYQSQAIMRYNMIFSQTLSIMVGSNTNLKAGDIIRCNFPKISRGNKDEYDNEQSGLYMIKELCHHFDSDASYTSMKLISDTFGTYGTNDK